MFPRLGQSLPIPAPFRPQGMIPRQEIVLSVLRELQDAADTSDLNTMTRVAQEVDHMLVPFQLPSSLCKEFPEWIGMDDSARDLFPADAPMGLLPLNCNGGGNLLFDAVSMLLVGNTGLSLELQVRTVVEMILWKRYYLSEMIDSKVMLQAVRFSLSAEESEEMLNMPIAVLEAIFDADLKASCYPGSYANMWHIYALSSVLKFDIYSIYPMFNLKIRPYFNRVIRPRTLAENFEPRTLHIMWSGQLQSGSVFRPDHFVALVWANDIVFGSPPSELRVSPTTSEELQNKDPQLSYDTLKNKYQITKSTFYRWKNQTVEHCRKVTSRYDAKYFLQACYLEGRVLSLQQFKELFPEISRSSYYNWKQELMNSGGNFSNSTEEASPGESTEQESWSSPEGKLDDPEQHDSVASMFGLGPLKVNVEQAQNMSQKAKRCLQDCIASNTPFPFKLFKRSFPGISRSTYYNWRKEAILFSRGFKNSLGSSEDSSDPDKSQSPQSLSPPSNINQSRPSMKISRQKHKSFKRAYISKKQLREAAKSHLLRSKCSLTKFKLRFPSMSPFFYWLWRNGRKDKKKMVAQTVETKVPVTKVPDSLPEIQTDNMVPVRRMESQNAPPAYNCPVYLQSPLMPAFQVPHQNPMAHLQSSIQQMLALDVVAVANFKVRAKLFLQQRFQEKCFPSFKEFRAYFPFTPRSTYYMWKRALHHGVSLVHG